ncbi:MAG: hypothetical protein HZB91_06420 [Elusimicrobia bacterium]|nr:hypothetical protein [Elusimicrobiota bacterium]
MEDHPLPRHNLPKDASEVEAIADLQTARLALRWALEKIRSVEKERAALQERADADSSGKRAALEDLGALQRTFNYYAARLQEAQELNKTLEARIATAAAEAAKASESCAPEWPAPPLREALESPAVGENALSIRQSYEERLEALKAEHAKELADLRKVVEEAASQTVKKVQVMAFDERERLLSQLAFERESHALKSANLKLQRPPDPA